MRSLVSCTLCALAFSTYGLVLFMIITINAKPVFRVNSY